MSRDKADFSRDALLREVEYRREKQWKIFSWASTILVALTGGVIALKTSESPSFALGIVAKVLLTASAIILGVSG